jgi:cation:H+ antiporter
VPFFRHAGHIPYFFPDGNHREGINSTRYKNCPSPATLDLPRSLIKLCTVVLVLASEKNSRELDSLSSPPANGGRNYREYQVIAVGAALMFLSYVFGYGVDVANNVTNLLMLAGSLLVLLAGSNIVLEFAVKLAEAAGVSELVIGLTIVSIGTSIPEMFTAILSSSKGIGGFVIGDIYGSYITQLTVFLGIVIIWAPRTVNRSFVPDVKRDAGLMVLALCFLSFNISDGKLTYLEATISTSLFVVYTIYLYWKSKKNPSKQATQIMEMESLEEIEGVHSKKEMVEIIKTKETMGKINAVPLKFKKSKALIALYVVLVLVGTIFCYVGAHWMVESGVLIAESVHVPEHIIAATIVGFGTGLPEFVVSFLAVRKRRYTIAYGNLLGSNVVDPLFSISLGVFTREITMPTAAAWQIISNILPIAILIGFWIIYIFSRKITSRAQGHAFGGVLIGFYGVFLITSLISG